MIIFFGSYFSNKFMDLGVKYVHRYTHEDLTPETEMKYSYGHWQTAFITKDPSEVEKLCTEKRLDFTWHKNGCLQVKFIYFFFFVFVGLKNSYFV